MQGLNYRNFKIGVIITIAIAVALLLLSWWIGKVDFFLMLNTDLGTAADYFFAGWTNLGDGLMWLLVLGIILKMKRKDLLPLIVSGFAVSTLITQVFKYLILPDELRPYKAIADHALAHTVSFVEPYSTSSFPSGHTGTAFSFYLLFCLILSKNAWLYIGLAAALLVGYSRIYLAQHFPLDVAAGMIVGAITMLISLQIQKVWTKRKKSTTNNVE